MLLIQRLFEHRKHVRGQKKRKSGVVTIHVDSWFEAPSNDGTFKMNYSNVY